MSKLTHLSLGHLSRALALTTSAGLLLGLAACAKPAVGTEREGDVVVRSADVGSDRRLTPQQIEQQKRIRQQAAKRNVEIQRAGYVKPEEQTCTEDKQCGIVAMHCCSCDYRGQLVAINREHIPQLAVRRTGVCQTYDCIAQKSDHESCQAKQALCKAGKCVLDLTGAKAAPAGIGVEPIEEEGDEGQGDEQAAPAEGAGAP